MRVAWFIALGAAACNLASGLDEFAVPPPLPTSSSDTGGGGAPPSLVRERCEGALLAASTCLDKGVFVARCVEAAAAAGWCALQHQALYECFAAQPPEAFFCDAIGPLPLSTTCAAQQTTFWACVNEAPAGLPPETAAMCTQMCQGQASLPCARPSCEADCVTALTDPALCNGAYAFMLYCTRDKAWACDVANAPVLNDPMGVCAWAVSIYQTCIASAPG